MGNANPAGGLPMSNILFAENVCENERIGSRLRGGGGGGEISRSSIGKDFTEPFPDPQVTFGTSHSSHMLLLYFETNVKIKFNG